MWSIPLTQITVWSQVISPFSPDYGVFLCDQSPVLQIAVLSYVISYRSQITVYSYVILRCTPGYSIFSCFKVSVLQITVCSLVSIPFFLDFSVLSCDLSLVSRLRCILMWPFRVGVYSRIQCVPVWSFPCTPAYSVFSCVQSLYSRLQCSLLMWSVPVLQILQSASDCISCSSVLAYFLGPKSTLYLPVSCCCRSFFQGVPSSVLGSLFSLLNECSCW